MTACACLHQHSAMRLTDELAARRLFYTRPVATMPDVLVLDIPARFTSPGLPLGRYYPIIIENDDELCELEDFLAAERSALVVPDLLARRSSALVSIGIIFCRYRPPSSRSPWVLLCHWPENYTAMVPPCDDHFARESYTIELFGSVVDLDAAEQVLLKTLGEHALSVIRLGC